MLSEHSTAHDTAKEDEAEEIMPIKKILVQTMMPPKSVVDQREQLKKRY
jgi:hypothetical protein